MTRSNLDSDNTSAAQSYRESHKGEGESYHRKFSDHIYRSVIWEIEQDIILDVFLHRVEHQGAGRLLDFACGTGRILSLLKARTATATGVDVSPSMLEVARRESPQARFVCADITRADDVDSERYDIITAFRFFPNAEPELRDAAMAKLSQLLAPNGVLVFNNHLRCGSFRHKLRQLLYHLRIKRNSRDLHCMSDGEAISLARQHGLTLVEQRTFGLLPILKEKRPLLPEAFIRRFERGIAGKRAFAPLYGHAIYVFRAANANSVSAGSTECSSN